MAVTRVAPQRGLSARLESDLVFAQGGAAIATDSGVSAAGTGHREADGDEEADEGEHEAAHREADEQRRRRGGNCK